MNIITNIILILIGSASMLIEKLDAAIAEAQTSIKDQNPKLHKHLEEY